ncbi:hypothetical protein H4Q32_025342 [Labeo rohita]|uniref:ISXO2-like transposase domain-containing protein n=1 Tax=Labeo rohita TaxID=84645 RepID=A0ABQ8L6H1_LABRO|nr:hypothetical protein H4Q32_025342 [Labeo rohita]
MKKSVRHKSIFGHSKVSIFKWMKFLYRFSQGLRLQQIDMIEDDIAGSSATLSMMAKKVREACVVAMDKLRRRRGQHIGGRGEFIYGRGRMDGGWKRRKWVFGMLGVKYQRHKSAKPVLRLVERRTRRELIPLIAHHAKRGSIIISDEWRAYRHALPQLGYKHYTVNHSVAFVDAQIGAHTQHIERAWRTYKENVWRLRGNRTEELLVDHLAVIERQEWLAKDYHSGPLGRLIHDTGKLYR